MSPARIKRGDTVKILTGKDGGKTGEVTRVTKGGTRATVEGLNMVKRHMRPTQQAPEGGIVEKEAPVHVSNLMLVCTRCKKPTRPKSKPLEGKKKVRVCRSCGEII